MPSGITRIFDVRSLLGAAATVAVLAACGGGGGSTAPKTGSLAVVVTAPTGVTGSVTVTGPNGYSTKVTSSTLLTGLAVGSYSATAPSITGSNAIVATINNAVVTGSPASVTAGNQDTVTATYTAQPGTGGLWVANLGVSTGVEYTAAALGATTSAAPATAIGTSERVFGATFDANGNLWLTAFLNDTIFEYAADKLGASGSPAPMVFIAEPGAPHPGGMAFDSNGNLWVANLNAPSIVEFSASQLGSSGSPTPAVTISSSGAMSQPDGLAFDGHGNLWVSNSTGNTIMEYTASQLASSGSPTPAVILTASSNSISGPMMIAFDPAGNLWVDNGDFGWNTLVAFSPSQLAASGSPTPSITLTATSGSLASPSGLAFNASGNMWVSNTAGNTVVEFAASQLVTSGSPVPNVIVSGTSLKAPLAIAFDPHATNLPIKPAKRR